MSYVANCLILVLFSLSSWSQQYNKIILEYNIIQPYDYTINKIMPEKLEHPPVYVCSNLHLNRFKYIVALRPKNILYPDNILLFLKIFMLSSLKLNNVV